jgi:hypothetical protein
MDNLTKHNPYKKINIRQKRNIPRTQIIFVIFNHEKQYLNIIDDLYIYPILTCNIIYYQGTSVINISFLSMSL